MAGQWSSFSPPSRTTASLRLVVKNLDTFQKNLGVNEVQHCPESIPTSHQNLVRSTVLLLSVSRMQEKFKLQMTAVLEQLATWPSTASRSTHNETANASGQRELTTDKAWPSINVKE